MGKLKILLIFILLTALPFTSIPTCVRADEPWCSGAIRPYGDYCQGRHGWYGAKKAVPTKEHALSILEEYFKGKHVTIGPIAERKWFFRAEIYDSAKKLLDIIIIDRRTGRIRSIL